MNEKTKQKLADMREQIDREHSGKDAEPFFAPPAVAPPTSESTGWVGAASVPDDFDDARSIAEQAGLGMFDGTPDEEEQQMRLQAFESAHSAAQRVRLLGIGLGIVAFGLLATAAAVVGHIVFGGAH